METESKPKKSKSLIARASVSILALLAAAAVIGWMVVAFFPQQIVPFLINQQLARVNQRPDFLADKDAITVFTVGTSSPLPGNRAQTGTAVLVNGHFFMFDVGPGVVQKSENIGLPLDRLDSVFITHWHSDHYMDLPYLINRSWVLGRTNDLHLYGPDGLEKLTRAIDQLLQIENQHRVDHHGAALMDISKAKGIPHEFKNVQGGTEIVYQQDGITVTAFDVNHEPIEPAVGYMIQYKGKKVVISGDTKKNDLVMEMAKDADLLVHEVLLDSLLQQVAVKFEESGNSRNAKIITDVQDYHSSPTDVADLARKANVKKLVLHHFAPAPDLRVIKSLYQHELTGYSGPIHFANDGDKFVVK